MAREVIGGMAMNLAKGISNIILVECGGKGARMRIRFTTVLVPALLAFNLGPILAADLPIKATIATTFSNANSDSVSYPGEAEFSSLMRRGFDRRWTYLSAGFGQANNYAIGSSWLPNGITVGVSTDIRDASRCSPFCLGQITSTLGRVGFTTDNSYVYVWGGLESRRDMLALPQLNQSYWAAGAGVISTLPSDAQFFLEFEQRTLRNDCGALCGSINLSSKSEDYIFRAGVRQDFAGLSDVLRKIIWPFGSKPVVPAEPVEPKRPTPFHGEH
jgi:hypothetical protein